MSAMKLSTLSRRLAAWLVIALAGAATTTAVYAANGTTQNAIARGKAIYEDRCAVCHGAGGKGDGPAAVALRQRPTNLATLTRVHGAFPADLVTSAIKGKDPVVAHGIPGMMIWGAMFLADTNGNEALADARIQDVVEFIKSIQVR